MNVPRLIRWGLAGCAILGIAIGLVLVKRKEAPLLVPPSAQENVPEMFNEALKSTYENVRARQYAPAEVRKLARLYHANRLFAEAAACYALIAARPPGLTARDRYYLADLALNDGDLAAAATELREVLRTDPGYVPARLALAEALFKSGQMDAAAGEFAAVLAVEAGHPQASLGLARIDLQRGDEDAAVARLEELLADHPESTSAAAALAPILERRGETDRAIAMSQWSLQRPEPIPPDPWMSELLTDVYDLQRLGLKFEEYFRTGQIDQARLFLRRIEQLDPANPVPQFLRGWAHAQAHHDADAVREYRMALEKGGDPEKICPSLVQALLTLGNVSEAATMIADYHTKAPDSVPLATAYADVALRQGDLKRARRLLEQVLDKQPYLVPQNMSLARILWDAGERAAAAQSLRRVALALPHDVASRALLGEFHLGMGDPMSAIPPLEQARTKAAAKTPAQQQLTAMLRTAYVQAGIVEVEKGRFEEAANYYDQAIRIAPADLHAMAGKASACVQLKQFGRAAEVLGKMASIQPENPTIYLSLGDVLYQDGRRDLAVRNWEKALAFVAADDAELRRALSDRLTGRITDATFQ